MIIMCVLLNNEIMIVMILMILLMIMKKCNV